MSEDFSCRSRQICAGILAVLQTNLTTSGAKKTAQTAFAGCEYRFLSSQSCPDGNIGIMPKEYQGGNYNVLYEMWHTEPGWCGILHKMWREADHGDAIPCQCRTSTCAVPAPCTCAGCQSAVQSTHPTCAASPASAVGSFRAAVSRKLAVNS